MTLRTLLLALALTALSPFAVARADAAQWCDDGTALATIDGSVGAGEYPGSSTGVGSGFGSVIGSSVSMHLDSNAAGDLAFATETASGCNALGSTDAIVVYLDSIPGVGITNTSQLTDHGDPGRRAISGSDGTNSADLGFAAGFGADFAIAIEGGGANLFRLAAGAPHAFVRTLSTAPSSGFDAACVRELGGLSMTDLDSQAGNPLRWVATLINASNSFRSNEFQGITTAGAPGANIGATAFTLPDGSFNAFRSVPSVAAFRGGSYYTDFDTFTGSGLSPTPMCGQLDSNSWSVAGFSDAPGDIPFGGTATSGDFARGSSNGNVTTGGIYSFRTTPGHGSLGVQPAGSDFTPGSLTLRTRNATPDGIAAIAIDVVLHYRNDQTRSQRIELAYSTDGTTFVPLPTMTVDTPGPIDASPIGWTTVAQTVTVGGIAVAPGAFFTLRWSSDDLGSAGSSDELAIGSIHLKPTYTVCGNGTLDAGETCDAGAANGTTTCGCQVTCTFAAAATACGAAGPGLCDAADTCDGAGACVDRFASAGTTCRAAASACDVAETCSGTSAACPTDAIAAAGTVCLAAAPGMPCDLNDVCNGTDTTCAPRVAPDTQSCRASTGTCDLGAMCDGSSAACPASAPAPATTVCRAAAGACDVAENCDGSTLACPGDTLRAAGAVCDAADPGDVCDVDDVCTGASAACPATFAPSSTVCRASTGVCDLGASCTGTAAACPASTPAASGTACRASAGDCDVAETCDGATLACPSNALRPAGATCRASAGDCDVAETCDGAGVDCPTNGFAASTVECRASAGDCDVAESCTGSSASCPLDSLAASTVTCRAAAGACDVAESCSGSSTDCPADAMAADGSACDDGDACTDSSTCNAGSCDGVAIDCDDGDICTADGCGAGGACVNDPIEGCCIDASDCAAGEICVDNVCGAGTDAGMGEDAGIDDAGMEDDAGIDDGGMIDLDASVGDAGIDAGAGDSGPRDTGASDAGPIGADAGGPGVSGGCGCRASTANGASAWWLAGLVALLVTRRRR